MKYKFFSNCILVKGQARSTVCDLQNNRFIFLPNEFVAFMQDDIIDMTAIAKELEEADFENFAQYVAFLQKENLLLEVNEHNADLFGEMPATWDYPSVISNAIVEIGTHNVHYIIARKIFLQLAELGCLNVEIRLLNDSPDARSFRSVLRHIVQAGFWSIDVSVKTGDCSSVNMDIIKKITERHNNIRVVLLYNEEKNEVVQEKYLGFGGIAFVQATLDSSKCGWIHGAYFDVHVANFMESQSHNTCLNRKISVDVSGNIKNCPSMRTGYGHISDTKLAAVVDIPGFTKYWNIKKDDIAVCRTCEFRHICTDCRAFTEDPADIYSKPLKCGYDPATTEWEEWSAHPLKQQAIAYYNL